MPAKHLTIRLFFTICLVCFLWKNEAAAQQPGIVGKQAQDWNASHWIQLPSGKSSLNPSDYEGKVIYLYCFQSWCPGCHKHGFPTLKSLSSEYKDSKDVVFVAIQTTFEGFSSNPPERIKEMAQRYELDIPFAHSGTAKSPSSLMANYRTGGTPWTIIIDRKGTVRYNDFHISAKDGSQFIDTLIKE